MTKIGQKWNDVFSANYGIGSPGGLIGHVLGYIKNIELRNGLGPLCLLGCLAVGLAAGADWAVVVAGAASTTLLDILFGHFLALGHKKMSCSCSFSLSLFFKDADEMTLDCKIGFF